MKGKSLSGIVVILLLIAVGGGAFLLGRYTYDAGEYGGQSLRKLRTTLGLIDKYYVDSVSVDSLIDGLIPRVFEQLDPHSFYLTAEQRREEKEMLEGHFFGIGVTFNMVKDTVIVISTVPNGPSDIVGIKPGDRIIAADGRNIAGQSIKDDSIRAILRGPEHSLVSLAVYRPKHQLVDTVRVRRASVPIRQMDAVYMVNDSLGCIAFSRFGMSTYNDFIKAYGTLHKKGMKGLIIDLRDNPGGILHAALLLSNSFLEDDRLIIYTEGRNDPRNNLMSDGTGMFKDIPLYILIDEGSASSSEIVSGALQDNDRAILIGRRSYGKGLVQRSFEYNDGSSLHLTVSRYFTPSGRSIQRSYKMGRDESYNNDWYERALNGEFFHKDSIRHNDNEVYKTVGGRTVYGGGGIIPDVFVPRDTVGYTSYFGEVARKGLIAKFAFLYADNHRDLLLKLGDAPTCYNFLKNQGLVWQFASYANTQGVRIKNYLVFLSQDLLFSHLSRLIISFIYGQDDAALIASYTDPMIRRAAEFFGRGVYSPLDLREEDLTTSLPAATPNLLNTDSEIVSKWPSEEPTVEANDTISH